jgi:AcrR family transcriptional regulator
MREQEREARKNIIIDAAVRLFAKIPYYQVGMREIAAEAGLSAASIYRYFSDRDELFVEALLRETGGLSGRIEDILAEGLEVQLENMAEHYVAYMLDHQAFFQMMTHFMVQGGISEKALSRFNEIERTVIDRFESVFLRIGARKNPRLRGHAFFAALNGILITYSNYPGRKPEEVRQHMLRLAAITADTFRLSVLHGTDTPA